MGQHLETEFKNIISAEEYQQLLQKLHLNSEQAVVQHNYYFDTPDFALRERHIGLRLRMTARYNHFTMKQPSGQNQMIEIMDKLSHNEATSLVEAEKLPEAPAIREALQSHQLSLDDMSRFASFETRRIEAHVPNGTLVLDDCHFTHFNDHELEMETTLDPRDGERQFYKLLETYSIPVRPSEKKMIRMQRTEPLYDI